ncbi:DUF1918 domain-containing protein [Streptomyces sp. NPDC008238]|uniref:DUF1918 domain-containing protein n=1 Tax=Actinacidiphila glaucinigra TaxID=235986 RepID=UPI002E305119|nr:DUF1918 domain-containing protein [Actinacidiphila glaucinigra]
MHANKGDRVRQHGRVVGQHDKVAEIVEVMGQGGEPPYRVRYDDGHECILSPGPDSTVEHGRGAAPTR